MKVTYGSMAFIDQAIEWQPNTCRHFPSKLHLGRCDSDDTATLLKVPSITSHISLHRHPEGSAKAEGHIDL